MKKRNVGSVAYDLAGDLMGVAVILRVDGPRAIDWRPRFLEIARALENLAQKTE